MSATFFCGEQLPLFEGFGGVDMAALRKARAGLAAAARAPNTARAYAAAWRDFEGWCAVAGLPPLPAAEETVCLYVAHLARERRVSTIEQRLAAISDKHRAAGLAPPVGVDVREVLAGVRRELGTAPRRKDALTVAQLREIVGRLPDDAVGIRDRALLLVGFASGLRRAELAGLDLADVRVVDRGLVVRVRRSKTDRKAAGRSLGVHRGKRKGTCPVRAVEAWVTERGSWPGPLFARMRQGGAIERARMSGAAVAEVVQRAVKLIGLDPSRYGGHSLRAGCATAAAERGASDVAIMKRTGHRSVATVEGYVRSADLFGVDPLRGAL